MRRRFALYWAPETGSELDRFGAAWLGYDAATQRAVGRLVPLGLSSDRLEAITAEPARYGFHATLKAPFELAPSFQPDDLDQAVADFCGSRRAFPLPKLELKQLGGFLALVPAEETNQLRALADDCVTHFDYLRAPLSAADLERRRNAGLTARQEALLMRWGYPYVLSEFRFHLTLTGKLNGAEAEQVQEALGAELQPLLSQPMKFSSVTVFEQEGEAAFVHRRRFSIL